MTYLKTREIYYKTDFFKNMSHAALSRRWDGVRMGEISETNRSRYGFMCKRVKKKENLLEAEEGEAVGWSSEGTFSSLTHFLWGLFWKSMLAFVGI